MTSKALDKENSITFGGLAANKGLGLGNIKSFQNLKTERINSTPTVSLEKKALINNAKEIVNTAGKQRRALGDVCNTTSHRQKSMGLGITPKVDRTFNCDNSLSGSKVIKSFSKLKLTEFQQQQSVTTAKKESQEEEELPQVERFIGSKYDNFDDLFSEGRLSEFYLASDNVNFSSNLNHRGFFFEHDQEDKIILNDDNEDDLFEIELKKVKKSLKKMNKKVEMKTQEIECLDDLMPKICEDSFEDF